VAGPQAPPGVALLRLPHRLAAFGRGNEVR
jgi:hypothetical protein